MTRTKIWFGVTRMYPYFGIGVETWDAPPALDQVVASSLNGRHVYDRHGRRARVDCSGKRYTEKEIAKVDVPMSSGTTGETSLQRWNELTWTYRGQMECIRESVVDAIKKDSERTRRSKIR